VEPLDSELRGLVAAERAEVEPRSGDRERVARSLGARVGAGFGIGLGLLSAPAAAAAAGGGALLKLGVAVVLAGAVAAVALPRLSSAPPASPKAQRPMAATSAGAATLPPLRASQQVAVAARSVEPTKNDATASRSAGAASANLPPLAEEARLLKQAQRALRDGKPAVALTALVEHERRFPRGQLALERSAARVQALCGLGRTQQAEREGKAFLQLHPGSGLAAQVRASCGFAAP